jgi:hypothetical protein
MSDDQNFNDDELAEIMNEIENLEDDMQIVQEEPDEFTVVNEVQEAKSVLEEVVSMPEEEVIPTNVVEMANPVTSTPPSTSGNKTSMNFSIDGQMTVDMGFTIGGQFVAISVNEDGFEISMESGAKFSIPLENQSSAKKAA